MWCGAHGIIKYSVHVLPSVSWGSKFVAQSPALDGAIRNGVTLWLASRLTLCWHAHHWAMGRLLSLLGSSISMAQGLGCSLPRHCPRCGVIFVRQGLPILTSLLPLQLTFTHGRFLTVCVAGLIWLSPFSEFGPPPAVASLNPQSLHDPSSRCHVLCQCWP